MGGEEGISGGVVSKSFGKNPLIEGMLPSINCCSGLRLPASSEEGRFGCGERPVDLPSFLPLYFQISFFLPTSLPSLVPFILPYFLSLCQLLLRHA